MGLSRPKQSLFRKNRTGYENSKTAILEKSKFPKLPFLTLDVRFFRNSDCLGRDSTKLTQLVNMKPKLFRNFHFKSLKAMGQTKTKFTDNVGPHLDELSQFSAITTQTITFPGGSGMRTQKRQFWKNQNFQNCRF